MEESNVKNATSMIASDRQTGLTKWFEEFRKSFRWDSHAFISRKRDKRKADRKTKSGSRVALNEVSIMKETQNESKNQMTNESSHNREGLRKEGTQEERGSESERKKGEEGGVLADPNLYLSHQIQARKGAMEKKPNQKTKTRKKKVGMMMMMMTMMMNN